MSQKKKTDNSFERLTASIKSGQIGGFYIFHGDERYLLEHSLSEIRQCICPDGLNGFNYKRFEGKDIQADELDDAINTLPFFAERTLIEIHDFDIFKGRKASEAQTDSYETPTQARSTEGDGNKEKTRLVEIFSDLPDYASIIFIYNTLQFKPDGRLKLDKEILKYAQVVEFTIQDQAKLTKWINRHFDALGKRISKSDSEYLAHITDGYMTALAGEIGKISAYSSGETITREDIDAVVTPVLNAFAYKLTDALIMRKYDTAMSILDELFQMREPPHKIMYSISLKMRQFLAARVCLENNLGKDTLIDMCGIRYGFQAAALMDTARKSTLRRCRDAVILCAEAAYDLNSAPEHEERLVELITRLAYV